MKYRIGLVGCVLFLIVLYISNAFVHALVFDLLFRIIENGKDVAFGIGFAGSIIPILWWPTVGIFNLFCWIITGHHLQLGKILDNMFDWFLNKIDESKDAASNVEHVATKGKYSEVPKSRRMGMLDYDNDKDYTQAYNDLNKEFPGIDVNR